MTDMDRKPIGANRPPDQQPPEQAAQTPLSLRDYWRQKNREDGTYALIMTGGWLLLVCMVAFALTGTLLGGMTPTGPRTTGGWLAVIFMLMCLPFGLMVFALGVAKSLRNWKRVQQNVKSRR